MGLSSPTAMENLSADHSRQGTDPPSPRRGRADRPMRTPLLFTLVLQLAYLVFGLRYPNTAFGLNQLHWLSPALLAGLFASTWVLSLCLPYLARTVAHRFRDYGLSRFRRAALYAVIFVVSVMLFVTLRNRFVNRDALATLQMIPREVPVRGAFLTHDAMLDLYLHSRFWHYAHAWLGWDVRQSYHVLSSIAGGFYVLGLLALVARVRPSRPALFLGFVISGGYVQLFFGDIENYAFVTVMILVYVLATYLFLHDSRSFVLPSLALSVAMAFHLVAGWLLPSYVYLAGVCIKRGDARGLAKGVVAFVAVFGAVLLFFHFNGLPIQDLLTRGHALALARGEAGEHLNTLNFGYYVQVANLVLLLLPSVILVPALVAERGIDGSRFNVFLILASLCALLFLLVWNAQLGVYQDWNLFAPLFVPVAVFVSWNLARRRAEGVFSASLVAFALTSAIHTYIWIVTNHFMADY
jgi:hypothetical protein